MTSSGFHIVDYILFSLVLLISVVVGIYHGCRRGRKQTTDEYLLGSRELKMVPVAISMFMSYVSGVLVLGNTAEMYNYGIQYWLACIGSSLAFIFSALVFVPLFFPLRFVSANEYYEARFQSKAVRVWSAIMFILSSIIYMGLSMYTPAIALNAVTGFPVWMAIIGMGVVSTFYTTLGGMKAVVWTDTIQGGILVAGIIVVLVVGSIQVGGIERIWELSAEGGRLELFNFDPDPTVRQTFWSVIFGRFFISVNYVAGQTAIQRYSTLPTLKDARLSALLNVPAIVLVYTVTCLSGLTVYAYYAAKGCCPLKNKDISNSNQLLPYFVMDAINFPGIPGIFIAVLFSGALSSISTSLNSMAACTWKDLLEWKLVQIAEGYKILITKLLVAFYGIIAVGMAFVATNLGVHILQASQSLVGGFGGPGLGLFVLGSFFPWANWQGALFGSLIGFGMTAWVSLGAYITRPAGTPPLPTSVENCTRPEYNYTMMTTVGFTMTTPGNTSGPPTEDYILPIYKMSYMYNAAWGCLITIIMGIIITLLTGPTKSSTVDPKLLVPLSERLCCCLPARWRRRCWCGVDYSVPDTKEEPDEQVKVHLPASTRHVPPSIKPPVQEAPQNFKEISGTSGERYLGGEPGENLIDGDGRVRVNQGFTSTYL